METRFNALQDNQGQERTGTDDCLLPRPKTLSLVRKVIDKIVRFHPDHGQDVRSADVRRPRPVEGIRDRLLSEPFNGVDPEMKDIYKVIRQKEMEISVLRDQIAALEICIPLLEDDPEEVILAEQAQTRS
jgi:hypothetical protein